MKWIEFKKYLESKGVTDNMDIDGIEFWGVNEADELDIDLYNNNSFSIDY